MLEKGYWEWGEGGWLIRRHIFSDPTKYYFDPASAPSLKYEQLEFIDWELTALFLEKVLGMKRERIDLIKTFATRLAELIEKHKDRRLFRELVFRAGEWEEPGGFAKAQMENGEDRREIDFGNRENVRVCVALCDGRRGRVIVLWELL